MAKQVAVIGSGPAGLACAQQLVRVGYKVAVFEKADRIGGLLRYGIPDFRLDKAVLDRSLAQLEVEGVKFCPGIHVGETVAATELSRMFGAVVLACGSEQARDVDVPGHGQSLVVWAIREGRQCACAVDVYLSGASVLPRV